MRLKWYKNLLKSFCVSDKTTVAEVAAKSHFQSVANIYRNNHTYIKETHEFNINVLLYFNIVLDNYVQLFSYNSLFYLSQVYSIVCVFSQYQEYNNGMGNQTHRTGQEVSLYSLIFKHCCLHVAHDNKIF